MPSVYILPVNEKNQKGEEEDVHTHAAHVHVCALLISQSSSNGEKERERLFRAPGSVLLFPCSKKKFSPIINDYTNVVPFRIPSYRNHRVVEIFIPTDFSRMVERPVIRRV